MFELLAQGKQRIIFDKGTGSLVPVRIPKSATMFIAFLRGAGGGGAGGSTAAVGAVARGGGAGGGGSRAQVIGPTHVFNGTLYVGVPSGGLGGAAGVAGGDPTLTGFAVSLASAAIYGDYGGRQRAAVQASSGRGGGVSTISSASTTPVLVAPFLSTHVLGIQGQPGSATGANGTAVTAAYNTSPANPGSAGGGISTAEVVGLSGAMTINEAGTEFLSFAGVGANTDGHHGYWSEQYLYGTGGVGGGAALTGIAGRGGNGATGCGGGGGGAARTGATAGAGGNGGDGRIDLWFL